MDLSGMLVCSCLPAPKYSSGQPPAQEIYTRDVAALLSDGNQNSIINAMKRLYLPLMRVVRATETSPAPFEYVVVFSFWGKALWPKY
ncbi:hypothetical protein K505DRAFT_326635 [Melanomma pulvis-pyrius CBS 109.77]|uniref:Uncharacterized protein n=1 Tax=Melanomma pulvis-pyrius CBS 109.77 TaxID=1314802 RepID=A0A6A6X609_9PLEO|nr:hypothetical protein K505DRAFT_326635 [Melanomma pulvis-pyrius CBS 109.77]